MINSTRYVKPKLMVSTLPQLSKPILEGGRACRMLEAERCSNSPSTDANSHHGCLLLVLLTLLTWTRWPLHAGQPWHPHGHIGGSPGYRMPWLLQQENSVASGITHLICKMGCLQGASGASTGCGDRITGAKPRRCNKHTRFSSFLMNCHTFIGGGAQNFWPYELADLTREGWEQEGQWWDVRRGPRRWRGCAP